MVSIVRVENRLAVSAALSLPNLSWSDSRLPPFADVGTERDDDGSRSLMGWMMPLTLVALVEVSREMARLIRRSWFGSGGEG